MRSLILTLACILLLIPSLALAQTLSINDPAQWSYPTLVYKGDTITISGIKVSQSEATTVSVKVTIIPKPGLDCSECVKTVTLTGTAAQSISFYLEALSSGTYSSPFSIKAEASGYTSALQTALSDIVVSEPADLIILSFTSSLNEVKPGDSVRIDLSIKNIGLTAASDTTATLSIPNGFDLSSGSLTYYFGSLAPGASASTNWVLKASNPAQANTVRVTVSGGGDVETGLLSISCPTCVLAVEKKEKVGLVSPAAVTTTTTTTTTILTTTTTTTIIPVTTTSTTIPFRLPEELKFPWVWALILVIIILIIFAIYFYMKK